MTDAARNRFACCFWGWVALALCLSVRAYAQTPPLPELPYITELRAEEHKSVWPFVNNRLRWVSMTVTNNDRIPFILRVTFGNGGVLVPGPIIVDNRAIGLFDMELRYKNPGGVPITKKFSAVAANSDGYIYELEFLQADVQSAYELEMWSILDARAIGASPGIYRERVSFEIIRK